MLPNSGVGRGPHFGDRRLAREDLVDAVLTQRAHAIDHGLALDLFGARTRLNEAARFPRHAEQFVQGDPAAQQCGWLKDRYGVSWQIVPQELLDALGGPDPERSCKAIRPRSPLPSHCAQPGAL